MSKTNEFILPKGGSSGNGDLEQGPRAGRARRTLERLRSVGTAMPEDTGNKLLPWSLVAIAIGFNLWVLRAEALPVRYLNDSSVHFSMVRWALDRMQSGHLPFDGWYPYLGLGSSLFHRYQSLPHIVTAALGFGIGADRAFTGTLDLLLASWPISVYLGARLLGWERWAAAGAAALSPLVVSIPGYGFEHASYTWRGLGVWSQLWGMWLLPIAWGMSWRAVSGRAKRYSWAALVVGLTAACHFIVGYGALLVLPIWVLVKPSEFRKRFGRVLLVGVGAVLIIAWVTVPLLLDAKYSTEYRYIRNTFWTDSYGARKVLGWLFAGELFDGSQPARLPVLSVLVAIGAVLCVVRARRDERARVVLGALALGLVLFSGRSPFGLLINLIPGNSDLLLHRFIFVVQMAGLLMAGVAVGWLAGLLRRFAPTFQDVRWRLAKAGVIAAVAALALAPAWNQIRAFDLTGDEWVHTQRSYDALDGADVDALVAEAKALGPGRFYAGSSANWGAEYKVWSVPLYTELLADDADAIGFYLRTQSLSTDIEVQFDDRNATQFDIFNIRYMIMPAGQQPDVPATLVDTKGSNSLWEMEQTTGYLQVVDALPPIPADRTNLSAAVEVFMRSGLPALGRFPTIAFAGAPGAPSTNPSGQPLTGPAGAIDNESVSIEDGVVSGSLAANRPAMVMLKASYDPRWTVTVDGQELPVQMVAPSFVGREVPPGHHEIVFAYRSFPRYDVLFAFGALVFFGLHVGPGWWTRRRSRRRERGKPA
jgi:hypothetical protein